MCVYNMIGRYNQQFTAWCGYNILLLHTVGLLLHNTVTLYSMKLIFMVD